MNKALPAGIRALVSHFSETREEALATGVELVEQPAPDFASLSETEVLVEVESACVAYVDLLMLTGQYHHRPPLPYTPGLEYAGVVRGVGSAVPPSVLKPGDLVMSDYMHTGPRSAGAHQAWGGWAQYAVAPHNALIRRPNNLSADAACNLLLNVETAYFALVNRANLVQGETVLVTGATRAAGLATIQVAKLLGARQVIAVGRGVERLQAAVKQGADDVIDLLTVGHENKTALRDAVKGLTGGRGVDVVIDGVGGEWLVDSLRTLSFGGRMVIVGWAANTGVAAGGGRGGSLQPDVLPTNLVQLKGLTVMGSPMVITGQRDPGARETRRAVIIDWMQKGKLTPVVSSAFPLTSLEQAMRARLAGGIIGGCVVRPVDPIAI